MDRKIGKLIGYLGNQNRAYINTLLKKDGMTYGECQVMLLVNNRPEISQEELRDDIKIDKSAITRTVKGLVDKGYIQKTTNTNDRRNSCLSLSKNGKEKMPLIRKVLNAGNERLLSALDKKEQEEIIILLNKMCDYIEEIKGD
ncbi:MAG: MarR family winged helix-turn-helix transcriptional regulator [Coprobacillaceae bacterium]